MLSFTYNHVDDFTGDLITPVIIFQENVRSAASLWGFSVMTFDDSSNDVDKDDDELHCLINYP